MNSFIDNIAKSYYTNIYLAVFLLIGKGSIIATNFPKKSVITLTFPPKTRPLA